MNNKEFYYIDENKYNNTLERVDSYIATLNRNLSKVRNIKGYEHTDPHIIRYLTIGDETAAYTLFREQLYKDLQGKEALFNMTLPTEWKAFLQAVAMNTYNWLDSWGGFVTKNYTNEEDRLNDCRKDIERVGRFIFDGIHDYVIYNEATKQFERNPDAVKDLYDQTHYKATNKKQTEFIEAIERYEDLRKELRKKYNFNIPTVTPEGHADFIRTLK